MRLALAALTLALAAGSAHASTLGDVLAGPIGGTLLFAVVIATLMLVATLCRRGSAYLDERTHASRVARLMDVLASQAEGIAGLLLSHPPAPTATLQAVREAAIAQSIAYVKGNLPATLQQIGVPDGVLAARLSNEVTGKMLGAAPAAPVIAGDDAAGDVTRSGLVAAVPQPAANPAG